MPPKPTKKTDVPTALIDEGFLRIRGVLALYPVSETQWYAGIKEGKHPKPVKLGKRTTAWRVADIRRLLETIG